MATDAVAKLELDRTSDVGRRKPNERLDGCLLRDGGVRALVPWYFLGACQLDESDPCRMIQHVCVRVAPVECMLLK
eukprot:4630787-Prymnesium_polylepis.1